LDIVDRLLAHDTWTTRQLLLACQSLPESSLDQAFEIDHKTLRKTFVHIIGNMETWTDLLYERPVQPKTGNSIPELLERLGIVSQDFATLTHKIVREGLFDDCFLDILDDPAQKKTFGSAIGHVITHNMHHRAQVMYLMEQVGLEDHIEGDLLGWENRNLG
jgi:uncharacterized damage-inducible protein DinB